MTTVDARRSGGPVDATSAPVDATSAPVDATSVSVEAGDEGAEQVGAIVKVALILTYLAAATTAWNGLKVGGLRLGDMLIGLALMTWIVSDLGRRVPKLPGWVWQFGFIIILITVAHELIPTDPHYLANRLVINGVLPVPGGIELETNGVVGVKFLVPVIFMPLMFAYARSHDVRSSMRSFYAFAVGSSISALIGMSDLLGATHISLSLTHLPSVGGRAPGLTLHPNFLAMTCVLSLPIMIYQLLSDSIRARVIALLFVVALLLGLYASASRAGAAVGPGAILLSVAVMPRYRKYLPTIGLFVAGLAATLFVLKPSLGHSLLQAVRLGGDTGSANGSDQARAIIFQQGVNDFKHSPIDGVGLQVAEEAHNVYVQALAAGGVILLTGYVIFVFSGIFRSVLLMKTEPLAYPLFVASVAGAIFVIVQAALTDRVAYVPLAIIATLPRVKAPAPDEFPETRRWSGPPQQWR